MKHTEQAAYLECVAPLLESEEVNAMKQWRRHYSTTCYEHSLFVSYVAYRMAKKFGWDARTAARAGLLHDLYLYDPADRDAHPGNQCLDHPEFALRNAGPCAPTSPSGRPTPSSATCSRWPSTSPGAGRRWR